MTVIPAAPAQDLGAAFAACSAGRFAEAETLCRRLLASDQGDADAWHILSVAQAAQGESQAALESCEAALVLRPDFDFGLYNRGALMHGLKRFDEALDSYDRALAVRPEYPEALNNRGAALNELGRHGEALASVDIALGHQPDYADALCNRGIILAILKRYDEALTSHERALAANPDHPYAFGGAAECAIKLCDWPRRGRYAADMAARVADETTIVTPFLLLGYVGDPEMQQRCAVKFVKCKGLAGQTAPGRPVQARSDKIRLAYLSADFRQHPTGQLSAGLFEMHDRERFEVIGLSFGMDDASALRGRLAAGFDQFHDVRNRSDQDIARLVTELRIDIAVDMMGHTQESRPGVLAARSAPVQVSFLGFPATMGAEFIDYFIGDPVVLPLADQLWFTERIVQLPDSYQVNDGRRAVAGQGARRSDAGLPENGFVFCCFNGVWKITPPVFDVWMRLLHQTSGSVLWLLDGGPTAVRNLQKEAQDRGIDPGRLVFAKMAPPDEHLARHRLADLFLDTLPCNAHTTASDALWAGVPVLTCRGEAFAGRVAASLLTAAGLPELIFGNAVAYEAAALALAHDPVRLAGLKARLENGRTDCALFDTARFTRNIETAYETMWRTHKLGQAPQAFAVDTHCN